MRQVISRARRGASDGFKYGWCFYAPLGPIPAWHRRGKGNASERSDIQKDGRGWRTHTRLLVSGLRRQAEQRTGGAQTCRARGGGCVSRGGGWHDAGARNAQQQRPPCRSACNAEAAASTRGPDARLLRRRRVTLQRPGLGQNFQPPQQSTSDASTGIAMNGGPAAFVCTRGACNGGGSGCRRP